MTIKSWVLLFLLNLLWHSSVLAQNGLSCSGVFTEETRTGWQNPALPPKLYSAQTNLSLKDIHYEVIGELRPGEEPLILIHGANSSLNTFRGLADQISTRKAIVLFDLRGSGKTKEPGAGYDVDILAADLLVLMNGLGISKAVLHGHSAGATTALAFAAKHPERVKALSLEDMSGMPYKERNIKNMTETKDLVAYLRSLDPFYATKESFMQAARDLLVDRPTNFVESMLQKSLLPEGRGYSPHKAAAIEELMMDVGTRDLSFAYGRYLGPISIMKAEKTSRYLSVEHVEKIRSIRPDVKIQTLPQTGHSIHDDQPVLWLRALDAFLADN